MDDSNRHAHWQIQYDNGAIETLGGFDPRDAEQRKFIHDNLDEYLDYLSKKMNNTTENVDCERDPMANDTDRFIVYGSIDTH
jgi:hypothetical protein